MSSISIENPERPTILDEAKEIVRGRGKQEYGDPEAHFELVSELWSSYIGAPVTSKDVTMLMILYKTAREKNQHKRDNLVDIAGFSFCGAKVTGDDR